ncbi:MAG: hypothetical protein IJR88_04230 [Clostridia bacterium]|nr:hypothetical protein [Clostridia bacterium]
MEKSFSRTLFKNCNQFLFSRRKEKNEIRLWRVKSLCGKILLVQGEILFRLLPSSEGQPKTFSFKGFWKGCGKTFLSKKVFPHSFLLYLPRDGLAEVL